METQRASAATVQSPQREREINLIIRELVRRFGNRVPEERIATEVQMVYDELCATSKVKLFIPILALRRARQRVHLIAERDDAFVAPVAGPVGPPLSTKLSPSKDDVAIDAVA